MDALHPYLLALIPLFVAIDALAVVPAYLGLTEGMTAPDRARTLRASVVTGLLAGLAFLALGRVVFHLLGITLFDFQIAGGAVLFAISVSDLLHSKVARRLRNASPGVVPLGVPLIVGPAVLTTILSSSGTYGVMPTLVAFVLNMLVAWLVLSRAHLVTRVLGEGGSRGVAKVMSLLLAAIGVMMIRRGVEGLLAAGLLAR